MTRSSTLEPEVREKRKAAFDQLMKETNSAKGNALLKLDGVSGVWPDEKIIRTGSLQLDLAIGIGGWPRGRVVEFYGMESSGKTTTLLHTVREAQAQGIGVVYIDAEAALDTAYCKKLGVDTDLMVVSVPDSLQQAIDLMNFLMETGREAFGSDLLIVVDSIPALAPSEVMEASAEQQTRALAARYWSAQLPRLSKNAMKTNTTLFLINQMRESMDQYTPASTPGGKAIKFFSSVRVEMKRKVEGKNSGGAEGTAGQTCSFTVVKNKVGSPYKQGGFWLPAGRPIEWAADVLDAATMPSVDVIHWDKKLEGDTTISKKNWGHYVLQPGDLDLMRADAEAAGIAFKYKDDARVLQEYQWKNFVTEASKYPSLIEVIERRVLETLNKGIPLDPYAPDFTDVAIDTTVAPGDEVPSGS